MADRRWFRKLKGAQHDEHRLPELSGFDGSRGVSPPLPYPIDRVNDRMGPLCTEKKVALHVAVKSRAKNDDKDLESAGTVNRTVYIVEDVRAVTG